MTAHPTIATMLRHQSAALAICRSDTRIEYADAGQIPGHVKITIISPTKAECERQIERLHLKADRDGAFSRFTIATPDGESYRATGDIVGGA